MGSGAVNDIGIPSVPHTGPSGLSRALGINTVTEASV